MASGLTEEAKGFESLANASTSGAEKQELLRRSAERLATANSATPACSCIYGLLVWGTTLIQLDALQSDPAARLVDVANPPTADLRGWELRPILPKDAVPVSSGAAGAASPGAKPSITPARTPRT